MTMFETDYAEYTPITTGETNTFTIAQERFFLVVYDSQVDPSEVEATINNIKKTIEEAFPTTLQESVSFLEKHLKQETAFSAGFIVDKVLYLVTRGEGTVWLARGDRLDTIISGDNSASGQILSDDFYIFTAGQIEDYVDKDVLKEISSEGNPKEAVSTLAAKLEAQEDQAIGAVFVAVKKNLDKPTLRQEESFTPPSLSNLKLKATGNKKLTGVILIILLGVLLYSVVFGVQRRHKALLQEEATAKIAAIEDKLSRAEALFGLNTDESLALLEEARADATALALKTKGENISGVDHIVQEVEDKTNAIKRSQEATATEFFDLSLLKKGATATQIYKEGEETVMLSKKDGAIYNLSIEKKATDTVSGNTIKNASHAALSGGEIFYLTPKDGIYKLVDGKGKLMRKTGPDDHFQGAVDMAMYNGNIYLLDSGGKINKYNGAEDGFASPSAYLKSGGGSLSNSLNMVIDSSVYVLTKSGVFRFTSGLNDGFHLDSPDKTVTFDLIYTDVDTDNLYLIDKDSGRLFVFSKNGEYKKQLSSGVLKKTIDFVVSDQKGALILTGDKIYSIGVSDDGKVERSRPGQNALIVSFT